MKTINRNTYRLLVVIFLFLFGISFFIQGRFIPNEVYQTIIIGISILLGILITLISIPILQDGKSRFLTSYPYINYFANFTMFVLLSAGIFSRTIPYLSQYIYSEPTTNIYTVKGKDYVRNYTGKLYRCHNSLYLIERSPLVWSGDVCADKIDWYGMDFESKVAIVGQKNIFGIYVGQYYFNPKLNNFTPFYVDLLIQHLSAEELQKWKYRTIQYRQQYSKVVP